MPVSDSESDEDSNLVPKLQTHNPKRSSILAGNKPRYSGLLFCEDGDDSTSTVLEQSQRDDFFLLLLT